MVVYFMPFNGFFYTALFSSGYTFICVTLILLRNRPASAVAPVNVAWGFGLFQLLSFASIESSFFLISKPVNPDRDRKCVKRKSSLLLCVQL